MPKPEYLFEVSWEICNKVGGIYTVISSKAAQIMQYYSDVIFIGPYMPKLAPAEFQHMPVPEKFQQIFESLKVEGIECYYGIWHIKGKPQAVLIDFSKFMQYKNGTKSYLWDKFKVDSLNTGNDFDEPVMWGWAVGKFIEKATAIFPNSVVQCHEWLSGAALLYLKDKGVKVGTVFTTHATILGRTIAGSDRPLYEILEFMKPHEEAKNYGVQSKHTLEKASAQQCDIFTTVSEITGLEAKYILGREPDLILPNGVDFEKLPDLESIGTKHKENKQKILEFIMPYFFPYYSFDLENTLFFYMSGRYEYTNKGIDVFINSLGELNRRLKKDKSKKTIIAFIFVPADVKAPNLDIIEGKNVFEDLQDEVGQHLKSIQNQVIYSVAQGKLPSESKIFDEDFLFDIKKFIMSFKKEGLPPLVTHELVNPSDIIIHSLLVQGLRNEENDNVKVIFYPTYLRASDGLMDMEYYSIVSGCHLGIFPSYYEPWGYTPLESAAYGVPAITTDLAGFGLYVQHNLHEDEGILVIGRRGKKLDEVEAQLTEKMYWFANLTKSQRIHNKVTAENFVRQLDWKKLVVNYIEAHDRAFLKVNNGS